LGKKVEEIISKLTVLDTLGEKLNKFESTMSKVLANVERVTKRVQDVKKSVEFINSQFETNKSDVTSLKTDISQIKSQNDHVHESMFHLQKDLDHLYERHIDLQTRSMRENLIFTGIPLPTQNDEDTEEILKTFMTEKIKMNPAMEFHRAHRFGSKSNITTRD